MEASRLVVRVDCFKYAVIAGGVDGISMPTPINIVSNSRAPTGCVETSIPKELATGPTFAHSMTKNMLQQEWNMGIEQAIEAEAQAQAICMATNDFHRAYHAFAAKQKPEFEGN